MGIGAAVIGGVIQSGGSKSAARTQAGAASEAAKIQAEAAEKAAKLQAKTAKLGIEEQRAAREQAMGLAQPFVDIGLGAGSQLQNLLADPNQGLEQINPIVDFLRKEGFEDIQESAAAGGRLGAGGTLKDLTQFNTDLTSTIVPQLQNQRFNQLFNTLGLGQNAAAGQGSAALSTGSNISNILGQSGAAQAQGVIGSGNAAGQGIIGAGNAQAGGRLGQTNALTGTISNLAGAAGAFPGLFSSTPPPPNVLNSTVSGQGSGFFGSGAIPSQLTSQNILGSNF